MVSSHLMFKRIWNVFEVLSKKKHCITPRSRADDLEEASFPVSEEDEKAAEVRKRSTAINETMWYVTYMHPEHVDSSMTTNALYAELTKWERLIMYNFLGPNLPWLFPFFLGSFVAALGIMKPGLPIRGTVKLGEQKRVVGSKANLDKQFFA